MKDDHCESCACIIPLDDMALEMQTKKVHPKNEFFWGKLQVVRLKWKCMGTPTAINKHNFLPKCSVCGKRGKWHTQCDCIVIITVKRAKD
jgi:hypothetical protein